MLGVAFIALAFFKAEAAFLLQWPPVQRVLPRRS
jgi:hypothetical protein